jgi:hypothetical protein
MTEIHNIRKQRGKFWYVYNLVKINYLQLHKSTWTNIPHTMKSKNHVNKNLEKMQNNTKIMVTYVCK